MSWVRGAMLESYTEVARSVGLDPERMLRNAGINPADLSDPERIFPARAAANLLEASAREADCPHFALLLAERRKISTLGPISLLLQHEATLGDFLKAFVRYQSLVTEALAMSLEDLGDTVILHIGRKIELDYQSSQGIDLAMAAVAHANRAIGGSAWRPESAHFTRPAPLQPGFYQRFFQCPLEFDSLFNGFVFAAAALRTPNPRAELNMRRYARAYLEQLRKPEKSAPLVERMRRSLHLRLPMGGATLDQVAEDIGMHPRTLQRLLEKEGLTFATVLSEARRELVRRYLPEKGQSVTAVAALVGYESPSSFTRWFRSEFGMSPQEWRTREIA